MKKKVERKSITRLEVVKIREATEPYGQHVRSSRNVNDLAGAAIWRKGEPPTEEFWIVLLNTRNRVLGTSMAARGSINECPISPREIFTPAILAGAGAVILIHNHPSGDPSPSTEDRLITLRICEAGRLLGIKVLDHVISAGPKYYSFKDDGVIE